MKQMTLTTIPLLCTAFAPLCADAQGTQYMDTCVDSQQCCIDEITPSANPVVTNFADPYFTADFIWWRAQEDGLDYAFNGAGAPFVNAKKGHLHHPHFSYEPGFKVGFGLKFKHDGWDFFSQYTRLTVDGDDSRNSVKKAAGGVSNVQANTFTQVNGDVISAFANEASVRWSLNFNVLDLELGRNFWVSKWLTMRPFVGMKFDWMDQDYKSTYKSLSGGTIASLGLPPGVDVLLNQDQDQWAVGLRAGLNTTWYMWKNWCIFGELALSGMLNDFDVTRKDTAIIPVNRVVPSGTFVLNHYERDSHPVTAVVEWSLGLRYETTFNCDDYMLQLQAGWEEQIWFNQNQFIFIPNGTSGDNLTFQGLTVKAAFYF